MWPWLGPKEKMVLEKGFRCEPPYYEEDDWVLELFIELRVW